LHGDSRGKWDIKWLIDLVLHWNEMGFSFKTTVALWSYMLTDKLVVYAFNRKLLQRKIIEFDQMIHTGSRINCRKKAWYLAHVRTEDSRKCLVLLVCQSQGSVPLFTSLEVTILASLRCGYGYSREAVAAESQDWFDLPSSCACPWNSISWALIARRAKCTQAPQGYAFAPGGPRSSHASIRLRQRATRDRAIANKLHYKGFSREL